MTLFQNMLSFDRLGKFGVSDPNFPEDWIEVDQTDAVGNDDAETLDSGCKFPSTMQLSVHYQKFGHEEDPQFRVVKAVLEWTSDNK